MLEQVDTKHPVKRKARNPCPFYGFHLTKISVMIDQSGNQCALMDGFSPCNMERADRIPDWELCPFNHLSINRVKLERFHNVQCFPSEFQPDGRRESHAIPFPQWYDYVMGDDVPRE